MSNVKEKVKEYYKKAQEEVKIEYLIGAAALAGAAFYFLSKQFAPPGKIDPNKVFLYEASAEVFPEKGKIVARYLAVNENPSPVSVWFGLTLFPVNIDETLTHIGVDRRAWVNYPPSKWFNLPPNSMKEYVVEYNIRDISIVHGNSVSDEQANGIIYSSSLFITYQNINNHELEIGTGSALETFEKRQYIYGNILPNFLKGPYYE